MKKIFTLILLSGLLVSFSACNFLEQLGTGNNTNPDEELNQDGSKPEVKPDEIVPDSELTSKSYTENDAIFANPERGFYKHFDCLSSSASALTASTVQAERTGNNVTLFYTGHYLTEFVKGDISDKYLQLFRKNMQALRDGGAKCLLRFAYTNSTDKKPYDATPEVVARHIEQLKPIIQEYSDVILCFQSGFIGVWGEGYYTDNFVFDPQTPAEHAKRKAVIDAMLDAIPADRQVALRTPMFKRNMYATSYTDTLTLATAYDGSAKARICAFNDCFGASEDDYGTFIGSGTREYWKKDTRYTLMGGETCGVSDYCTCKQSMKDLEDFHWTYLNQGYNASVLSRWESQGCMDDVKRRLGYRLSLTEVAVSKAPVAGENFRVKIGLKNSGFAAPANPRAVELILVDGNGKKTVFELKDVDPRYWFANETNFVDKVITLPADASGKCVLYLNLPDPYQTIHDNPLYSVRLANDNVWDSKTGYNKIAEFTL